MPTPTYIPLATVTLGSSASSVTFSSIPATYRDLVLVTNVMNTTANELDLAIRFNGDTGGNYNRVAMTGNGSSPSTFSVSGEGSLFVLASSNSVLSVGTIQIMDYSATDKHKTVLARGNITTGRVSALAGRWGNTAAITTVQVRVETGNLATGSTLALYGIAS